ncbi:MAG: GGDEF domain-containing protein [Armatimonadetes bacterium]|nr:GGDEF domain-containing protein [Armatimonadota bacterium]
MKTVRQVMQDEAVACSPHDNVAFAMMLLQRFKAPGLPVVESGRLTGIVEATALYGHSQDRPVSEVMARSFASVSPEAGLQEAVRRMDEAGAVWLPVVEGDLLAGVIAKMDILARLANPTDPKTDLPTSDALRERCVDLLKAGKEPVVLFIDIDGFGVFNKRYGHVVGDRVLVAVARLLEQLIEPESDFAARFGGDEFAIVTSRPRPEARQLASLIREKIRTMQVEGLEESVRASVGVSGGLREKVRPHTHYEATVDDLINLASRESTQEKARNAGGFVPEAFVEEERKEAEKAGAAEDPAAAASRRPRLLRITFSCGDGKARVQVELQQRQATYIGLASGPDLGENSLRLVVQATLDAVGKLAPGAWEAVVEGVHRSAPPMLRDMISAVIVLGRSHGACRLLGASFVEDDPYRAAACAALDAINRPLSGATARR